MEKSRVAVVPCGSYEEDIVYQAIKDGLAALGGIESFVKKDEKILLKPNFLSPAEEEKVITTNPAVIKTVCRLLSENEYSDVMVGDSPGHGTSKAAMEKLNLSEADLFGVKLADMSREKQVKFPEGNVAKSFWFCEEVTQADAIIGLCKMKTHMLERVTGGVKNMYGLICGKRKAAGHVSYPTAVKFAKFLADIHRATPQRLHIMDAVVAMEGNGPASGTPTNMNLILISSDPVALDTVFCWLINLAPELVPTNIQGELAGIGTFREEGIEVVLTESRNAQADGNAQLGSEAQPGSEAQNGAEPDTGYFIISKSELVSRFGKPDFDVQRDREKLNSLSLLSRISGGNRRPVIDESKCVKCGLCVAHCPVEGKGVDFRNGKDKPPVYDYRKCIRCYCCQELCPQKAISVK